MTWLVLLKTLASLYLDREQNMYKELFSGCVVKNGEAQQPMVKREHSYSFTFAPGASYYSVFQGHLFTQDVNVTSQTVRKYNARGILLPRRSSSMHYPIWYSLVMA